MTVIGTARASEFSTLHGCYFRSEISTSSSGSRMYTVYMYELMASLATWGKPTFWERSWVGDGVRWDGVGQPMLICSVCTCKSWCSADDGVVVWGGVSEVGLLACTLMKLCKNQNKKDVPGSNGGISYKWFELPLRNITKPCFHCPEAPAWDYVSHVHQASFISLANTLISAQLDFSTCSNCCGSSMTPQPCIIWVCIK